MHHMIRIYLQTKKRRIIYIGCYKDVIKYINVAQILINIFSLKNVMFLCKESVLLEQLNIHLDRQNPRFCFKKFQGLSNRAASFFTASNDVGNPELRSSKKLVGREEVAVEDSEAEDILLQVLLPQRSSVLVNR